MSAATAALLYGSMADGGLVEPVYEPPWKRQRRGDGLCERCRGCFGAQLLPQPGGNASTCRDATEREPLAAEGFIVAAHSDCKFAEDIVHQRSEEQRNRMIYVRGAIGKYDKECEVARGRSVSRSLPKLTGLVDAKARRRASLARDRAEGVLEETSGEQLTAMAAAARTWDPREQKSYMCPSLVDRKSGQLVAAEYGDVRNATKRIFSKSGAAVLDGATEAQVIAGAYICIVSVETIAARVCKAAKKAKPVQELFESMLQEIGRLVKAPNLILCVTDPVDIPEHLQFLDSWSEKIDAAVLLARCSEDPQHVLAGRDIASSDGRCDQRALAALCCAFVGWLSSVTICPRFSGAQATTACMATWTSTCSAAERR
eukprot:COSAG01_NODE_5472_length_4238_cov_5.639613_2_plen_372_part_00